MNIKPVASEYLQKQPVDQINFKGSGSQEGKKFIGKPYFQGEQENKNHKVNNSNCLPYKADPVTNHFLYKNMFIRQQWIDLVQYLDRFWERAEGANSTISG